MSSVSVRHDIAVKPRWQKYGAKCVLLKIADANTLKTVSSMAQAGWITTRVVAVFQGVKL